MNLKLIILPLIFLLGIIFPVNAATPSIFVLDAAKGESSFEVKDNIYTKIQTIDEKDIIKHYEITIQSPENITGIDINISERINIKVLMERQYYTVFGFNTGISYMQVTQFATFKNYTIFYMNETYLDMLGSDITISHDYDLDSSMSTFKTSYNMQSQTYANKSYLGLPAFNISFNGLSKFDLKIDYVNHDEIESATQKYNNLNPVLKFLYDVLDLITLYKASSFLMTLFSLFNMVLNIVGLIFAMIFIYPYIIILYIITVGNFYCGFKSSSWKDFLMLNVQYYTTCAQKAYQGAIFIYDVIVGLFQVIRG